MAEKKNGTFAVIETGGKQYQVFSGDTITIEKLPGDLKEGDKITFDKVLLVDNGKATQIGDPYLQGAKVEGTLESEGRGKKVEIVRFKPKSRYMRRQGHRQHQMRVLVGSIK